MSDKKLPILKKSVLFFLLIIFSASVNAQSDKIYIEGDAVVKFPFGKEKRKNIQYRENINVNVPKISRFENPVHGLNFSLNYEISHGFSAGVGSGINVIQTERHPVIANEYYHNILFPLFIKFRYQKTFAENWLFLSDLNGGYQFSNYKYGNSNEGFVFKEKGGLLGNIDLGVGIDFGKYTPILKLGYEINQFTHEDSLGWVDESLQYEDKIEYETYYNFIKLSLGIKI